jgi:hypothetical protein
LWFFGVSELLDVIPRLPIKRQEPHLVRIPRVHQVQLPYRM